MKFGVVESKDIPAARDLSFKITKFLQGKGREVVREKFGGCEAVLSLGGDGTLIHTACQNAEFAVPFFGINAGTLGFLTAAEADDWQEALEKIIKGDYFISERMTVEASLKQKTRNQKPETYRAVNEIVIKGMYRVVKLEILAANQKFLNITGDGVLISTPTGSTAYSLSAGGPIVDPQVDCLLLTPINAVGLPIPSVALSADDQIEIKILEGADVSLIVDGQEHIKITQNQNIKVRRGEYRIKLGYFGKPHFLKALNAKFGLGGRLIR